MENFKNAPALLHRKFYLTALIGLFCLITGAAVYFFSHDVTMLMLSGGVCALSMVRAYSILKTMAGKTYETVEGTCIGITPKLLRKYKKICIIDDNGNESDLLLNKHDKVKTGGRYRFFFKKTRHISLGGNCLSAAMSVDCFLGYEEINSPTKTGEGTDEA